MQPRILAIDDDPDIRRVLQMVLESAGFTVDTAGDGEEGLRKVREEAPDLIILDLLMPRLDGYGVLRALKEKPRWAAIPTVILTAVGEEASQRRYELETGLAMDVDDYIEKPLRPAELLHRVSKVLERLGKRAQEAGAGRGLAAGGKRILLIDDDADFVAATRIVLERHGYAVTTAPDGDLGLEAARRERPDLIILDVIMPLKSGFTVCQEVKRDPALAGVPVLMLTSFAGRVHETDLPVSAGMSLEAEDYLDKPAPPEVLVARVARLLGQRRPEE